MDNEETEISDLQTAKVALHGALSMMRNLQDLNARLKGDLQDAAHREKLTLKREVEAQANVSRIQAELNQLKVYYAAFEGDLKEKARQEAAHEEQVKWEHRMTKLQESVDTHMKSRALKEEELQRVRDDVLKKDKAISLLLEQSTAAKLRMHAEWSVALEKFETKHVEQLHAAGLAKEKEAQAQWAARVGQLQERCKSLEQELADKDHVLTQEFHMRIRKVVADGEKREQGLWDQTQSLRDTFETEMRQRYELRFAKAEMEHKAALMAQETRMLDQLQAEQQKHAMEEKAFDAKEQNLRAAFEEDEAARVHVFNQKIATLEMQWAAREKTLREEKEEALHALRQTARQPQAQFKEEMEAYRARTEEEFIQKEQLMRENYLALERAAHERAQRREMDYLAQLAEEKEKMLRIHADTLHVQLNDAENRYQAELLKRDEQFAQLRASLDQNQTQSAVLQKQLLKLDEERRAAMERVMSLELDNARAQNAAQASLSALNDKLDENHRAAIAELQHELQKQNVRQRDLENEIKLAHQTEEGLRAALTGHDTKLAERYATLEKALREKERELDLKERRLNEESAERRAELSRGSTTVEQRQNKLQEDEAALEQRRLQLEVLEKQTQFLRDQLTAALRQTENIDGKTDGTSQRLVDDWMFGFAHQIRNPLAIIRSTAEALADDKASAVHTKALNAIIQSADGLAERLVQFMEFSKPMDPLFKPIALNQVMREALEGIRDALGRANVKVSYTCEEKLPLVPGNAVQFQDAMTELLLNALEEMPQGGKLDIRVSYDAPHDQVIVMLQDSGRGISADHLMQIGKPFFTTKSGHAGLGLAHVKRVLHLYAGEMKIESPANEGTQVRCYFRRKGWAQ